MAANRIKAIRVYGLHKCATMFLYRFFGELSRKRNFEFFSSNKACPDEEQVPVTPRQNLCVCPIRSFDDLQRPFPGSHDESRIVQIRDPRDMLVSEYFSFGWSHSQERGEIQDRRRQEIRAMTIDEYVLRQSAESSWPLEAKFQPLLELEHDDRILIVKYETMVLRFSKWVRKVIRPFGFWSTELATWRLVYKYRNEFQATGDYTRHKRAVLPGDHLRQLKPETIEVLNGRFAKVLDRFGY